MSKVLIIFLIGMALPGVTVIAETVYIPVGQQAADKQTLERPRQGMTKDQVQKIFGEPGKRREAVGDPPISSWVYADFAVYFEYERVIHSVLSSD